MREAGTVVEIKGEMAVVELARTKACQNCKVCLTSSDSYKMITEAKNAVNASVGDEIYLELESRNVIVASLIVYILPLLLMSLGYFLGAFLGARIFGARSAELTGIVVGFAGLAGAYPAISVIDKRISKAMEFVPVVARVIAESKTNKVGE